MCGNVRTFLDCFDRTYKHIISKLFKNNNPQNTHILFYLKCDDPGPKGQKNWDFQYKTIEQHKLTKSIQNYIKKYKHLTFHSRILPTNEISDRALFSQIKDRKRYIRFLDDDKKLVRALHCHYNLEQCGKIIEKIQSEHNLKFDYFIYIRPDLLFNKSCKNIRFYNQNKLTLGKGPNAYNNDHLAIIPRKYKNEFFFARMHLIRTNTKYTFHDSEMIYWHTIKRHYEVKPIGEYIIKRT